MTFAEKASLGVLGSVLIWAASVWAIAAYGSTALSSASPIEPASLSRPTGLQSTIAGEN